ncbi:MAG TPA: hypothetical protein VF540_01855, partial [Segetibacter sp.]
ASFNLVVLAFLGLLLRYKMNFSLELFNHINLLHAHSHFAFTGWISFLLQLLILDVFTNYYKKAPVFWNKFLSVTTIINYATIASFAAQGYSTISVIISTLSLWLSYVYAYKIFKVLPKQNADKASIRFIKYALVFLVLSSLGPCALAVIKATKTHNLLLNQSSIGFFVHFQYNGWFTLAVLGVLFKKLEKTKNYNEKFADIFFSIITITCFPSFFLSLQWPQTTFVITAFNVFTGLLQASSLYFLARLIFANWKEIHAKRFLLRKSLFFLSLSAFSLKILLQLLSTHPYFSQVAFSSRPIQVGYLHLVFLLFITVFLTNELIEKQIINIETKTGVSGVVMFLIAIILNEVLLVWQGLASLFNANLPILNFILFINTLFIFAGAALIFVSTGFLKYLAPEAFKKGLPLVWTLQKNLYTGSKMN